ncbi:hypothetical protein KBI33_02150 [Candidatus Shapirobacteria bacterium]|nr:hypothetical protein [Candidatus Shapirobacteria bacterium]
MPTLTETAAITRKVIKYSLIGIIGVSLLVPALNAFQDYWEKTHPAPPPGPTVAFGQIPPIIFPQSQTQSQYQFQLETIEGVLPNLATQGKVYFVFTVGPKFFDEEKTREKARFLGFPDEIARDPYYRYTFKDPKTNAILKLDMLNENFEVRYPFEADPFFVGQNSPNPQQALGKIQNFLGAGNSWPNDIDQEKTKNLFFKYDQEKRELVSAPSLSEAEVIKVNLFRTSLDNLPLLPPNPQDSNISFFVAQKNGVPTIIAGKYIHFPVQQEQMATYPLKNSTLAWEELRAGKAFIGNLGNNSSDKPIIIRRIYLAYFDPSLPQNFLQPIFVFEGDNDFIAYLSALDPSWIKETASTGE